MLFSLDDLGREPTRADVRRFLNQLRYIETHIQTRMDCIEELRALAERRTSVYGLTSGSRASSSPDKRMDAVAQLVDTETELDSDIRGYVELKAKILNAIAQVKDDRMQTLLELRYVQRLRFEAIACQMDYSRRQVFNLHNKALDAVAKRLH